MTQETDVSVTLPVVSIIDIDTAMTVALALCKYLQTRDLIAAANPDSPFVYNSTIRDAASKQREVVTLLAVADRHERQQEAKGGSGTTI